LASGGIDSAILLAGRLSSSCVLPIFVKCGLRWESVEQYWLRRYLRAIRCSHLEPLAVVSLGLSSLYGRHWSVGGSVPSQYSRDAAVFLPGRNIFLLSAAGIVCAQRGIGRIAIGTLSGNPFGDASAQFYRGFARQLGQALGRSIRVEAPFLRKQKAALIRAGRHLPLEFTFSCLAPKGRQACGGCNKCGERKKAFGQAAVQDPTLYAS
jgi:7-cyano-7-deazaguanine synthase